MQPCNVLLHHILPYITRKCADKAAVVENGHSHSYGKIDELSSRLSYYLQALGLNRGDRVLLCLGNKVETIIAFWAVLKAGYVVCNVGLDTSADKLNYIIDNSQASVLITNDQKFKDVSVESKSILFKSVVVGNLVANPLVDSWELATSYNDVEWKNNNILDVDLATIVYTSGSTGMPKGVMLTHRNMCAALDSLNTYLGYKESDHILCSLPLSFDYGLYQMIMSISKGATLFLEQEFTWPLFLIKKIKQQQITVIPFVPTMLSLLYEHSHRSGVTFPDVRIVTNTGAALKSHHIEQMKALFPSASIFSMYGLTECKRCTYLPPDQINNKPDSVGIAIPNTEMWLVDSSGNKITKPNQVGELVIRGSTVMAGYWRNIEATQKKLKPGPLPNEYVLHTGDLGLIDEEGYLYFRGRTDHVIKSRGMKVSPVEIENYLYSLPNIVSAAVVGVDDESLGGTLHAFIQISDESVINEYQLLEKCRIDLEPHQVPHTIRFLTSFPRTPNGKFDLIQLKQMVGVELASTV
ncbi:class I adenylate-forming enzyme family protein [Acinetobacter zhairhuonensis]|uniref:class I adenylate-forming enzyme family protein n=1 Tax=Acinetobacter sp. A7.4 TaxID=2919921 RepID=UPI001F4F4CE2|nr:class I adenylate-forming enzyme family protein [Acinetobacter sp. A7.4]MCJ8162941.1 acyl--CoA ligase [Acinetobacter sp. A7.4]